MSISPIASSNGSQAAPLSSNYDKQLQDFKDLASSLQTGNLSGAQNAFTAFLQDSQGALQPQTAAPPAQDDPLSVDIGNLLEAIQSGDTTNAEKALTAFIQDLQGVSGAHHKHHHHSSECNCCQTQEASTSSGYSNDNTADDSGSSVQAVA